MEILGFTNMCFNTSYVLRVKQLQYMCLRCITFVSTKHLVYLHKTLSGCSLLMFVVPVLAASQAAAVSSWMDASAGVESSGVLSLLTPPPCPCWSVA